MEGQTSGSKMLNSKTTSLIESESVRLLNSNRRPRAATSRQEHAKESRKALSSINIHTGYVKREQES